MGCACSLLGQDESEPDEMDLQTGVNDVCPQCGRPLAPGDRIWMDAQHVVYHYDCLTTPGPSFKEGVVSQ